MSPAGRVRARGDAILEDKRCKNHGTSQGYLLHSERQESRDHVRQMITQGSRYQAIRENRVAR